MNKITFPTILSDKKNLFFFLCFFFFSPCHVKAQYTLNSVHGDLSQCDTLTKGVFIVWWDANFNFSAQADQMLDSMMAYRQECLTELGMQDPLSVQDGFYCNIYFHVPGNATDYFSTTYPSWGNGVGGDVNGYPFMTLPVGVLNDWRNLAHETFHIFQSHGMWDITPGIYATDDGGWFVEASANWYSYQRYPDAVNSFIESEILIRIPHVPMWLGWANLPSYYPNNWQRQVHQYALSTYLYYLTNNAGIGDSDLVNVFYSGTNLSPQEYLFNQIGGSNFRQHFIDCAAHMTNNFDFILPAQVNNARNEWNNVADPVDDNQYIQTYNNSGSGGWFQPQDSLTTNAWSFNTYKLTNSINETYSFEINAEPTGNYGDPSYFQGKVMVQNSLTGVSFHDVVMNNDQQGLLTLNLTPNDTAVYFIIASMPEVFVDNNATFQLFLYQMRISTGSFAALAETEMIKAKQEVARYNWMGQQIPKNTPGLQVIVYNDGSTSKCFVQP